MRIGLYSPSWPGAATPNGITTANVELTAGLQALGHDVSIITSHAEELGDNIFGFPEARRPSLLDRIRLRLGQQHVWVSYFRDQVLRATRQAIAERGIEILVMEETQGIAGALQAELPIPVVMVLHGPWFIVEPLSGPEQTEVPINRGRAKREGRNFHRAAALCAPSAAILNRLMEHYGPLDQPTVVIPNSIAIKDPVDPSTLSDAERRTFLYVGRFDKLKGGDVLLEGFARIVENGADCNLTIIGPDLGLPVKEGSSSLMGIEACLAQLPAAAQARITWLGTKSKPEIDLLRRRFPVTLITSRYETFGYTVLEAMAAGSVPVASDVGGIPEIVENGQTGVLVPPGDPQALAIAAAHLLEIPMAAHSMGARARKVIAERFAPTVVAQQWERFLEDVIARQNV